MTIAHPVLLSIWEFVSVEVWALNVHGHTIIVRMKKCTATARWILVTAPCNPLS